MRSATSRNVAITAGGLAVLLGAIDTYVVVTIMEDIMGDVGIPLNKIQQVTPIITGYMLAYVAAMPLLGRTSDRFGRKPVLQLGLAAFAIGSVITAMAGDLNTLVIGRVVLGAAAGALLPVTLALAADLWDARDRTKILGGVGAAQELGSVLGPVWGIVVVSVFNTWRDVFWINLPLTAAAMIMIHFSLPGHDRSTTKHEKVDVVGGVLLAVALGLAVIGLYNPSPDGRQVLPAGGMWLLIAAAAFGVGFFVWEYFTKTRLIDPAGMLMGPFLASLAASACTGAALMVTLVNIELFGRGVLGASQTEAALHLLWFLVALPIGAIAGGFAAGRFGDRVIVVPGMLLAAFGYWLISHWDTEVMSRTHNLGFVELPIFETDLAIAGLGLGLVIAPLTSAALRVTPSSQHGIASSLVVVSRMIGMLVGVAALSAWGLYRFNQLLRELPPAVGDTLPEKLAAEGARAQTAFAMQYGEMFFITAIVCVVGAVVGLFIAGRNVDVEAAERRSSDEAPAESR
ncbi:MFS transporter [Mycolicibacterium brumae]|uniref:MFS-type drug efflux transporter P55 n=1 Tax=Mycolicibacterium brumae TaxID=85968 RepID=A0A2G5PAW9_9MYCO|nr:MFS transporter [Mycolicibacterium brumae]MCV7193638.1 MFS transporter [Mycolicibacterium brumae]PIB75034.1 MFS transporter [Mycolicibacterium brumae]RWA17337.1 hypothetical protein MBRU_06845 [Mycolicibacterium brumae DSM 44177]UWW09089.1 MFS transporter [Mycolicibacterium brumae]